MAKPTKDSRQQDHKAETTLKQYILNSSEFINTSMLPLRSYSCSTGNFGILSGSTENSNRVKVRNEATNIKFQNCASERRGDLAHRRRHISHIKTIYIDIMSLETLPYDVAETKNSKHTFEKKGGFWP